MIACQHLSLSQRLLIGLGIVSVLFWIVMVGLAIDDDADDITELFDAHMAHTAHTAQDLLRHIEINDKSEANGLTNAAAATILRSSVQWPQLHESQFTINPKSGDKAQQPANGRFDKNLRFQALRRGGSSLFRSENAPDTPLTDKAGFFDTTDQQGKKWRQYNQWNSQHDLRVVVSEPYDQRNQLVHKLAASSLSPLILGLPILILLLWLSVRRGLAPLSNLSREIAARTPDNLALLGEDDVPAEVKPIVSALNGLLQRVARTMENERRFTDDAAHELRTPLAAIQAQWYAVRRAESEEERQRTTEQLQCSVNRCIGLVSQLLNLARLEPELGLTDSQALNLGEMAQAACAELAPLALAKDQALELRVDDELPLLTGNADLLSMLLCNLVSNAIRYTGHGGHIDVTLRPVDFGLQLEVCDDGPGIPIDQREKVFERFYRIPGQLQPGTGLGLTICRRITQLHHASIKLSDGLQNRGLTVRVDFPALIVAT